jgi:hypothetical protein
MTAFLTLPLLTTEVPPLSTASPIWQSRTLNIIAAAEELLDWAEAHGFKERQLVINSPTEFVVKWR